MNCATNAWDDFLFRNDMIFSCVRKMKTFHVRKIPRSACELSLLFGVVHRDGLGDAAVGAGDEVRPVDCGGGAIGVKLTLMRV